MKTFKKFIIGICVMLVVIYATGVAMPLEEGKKEQQMSEEEQIKLWKELTSPSTNHKHLQYFAGNWDSVQEVYGEPGSEPVKRKQVIRVESLYEGRYTLARIKFTEKILDMDIEGIVITGHDNYKKKFVSVTFGNMSTDLSFMSGTLDKTGKIRTDFGEQDDAVTGAKVKVKAVTTILSPDKYTYDYYHIDSQGKKENKVMTITYFRKK